MSINAHAVWAFIYRNNPIYWDRQTSANRVYSDQTLQNATFDQGLHCSQSSSIVLDASASSITKIRLYNFDPLKPHFYIEKTGVLRGIHYFFLFLLKIIDCRYSLEPPHRGGSNEYLLSMFWTLLWKISEFFYLKNFHFYGGKIFSIYA